MITIVFSMILIAYLLTIGWLIFGFTKINSFEYIGLTPKTNFTIIVPFRDEAENLPLLLDSFSKLNYPKDMFEVILVDDESEEVFKVQSLKFKVSVIKNVRISNSPKKDAITTAMQQVKTDWVITTDADCVVNKDWLLSLDNYIQLHHVSMVVGSVTYNCTNSFLHHFQQLDMASLQGATIGSFGLRKGFMCNGANFAYTKSLFEELNGFEGNNGIASGDDVFLLQKAVARFPKKVHYLKSKNNIVITKPAHDWKSLFYQRVRWASKTGSYHSGFGKALGLVVILGNLAVICVFGSFLLEFSSQVLGIWNLVPTTIGIKNWLFFILILSKFVVDAVLIYKTNAFFKSKTHSIILGSLWYPFFSTGVALYAMLGKYEWKGRRF